MSREKELAGAIADRAYDWQLLDPLRAEVFAPGTDEAVASIIWSPDPGVWLWAAARPEDDEAQGASIGTAAAAVAASEAVLAGGGPR